MFGNLLLLSLGAILTENFVLVKFLGICPFLGVSKKVETSIGMGFAVTFVMAIASIFTWIANTYLLVPLGFEYLQTIVYILIIATLVQFVEMFLQKSVPVLYNALGIYLPLITTNCAVLGVVVINTQKNFGFIEAAVYGTAAGLSFLLAIVLFAGIRERLEYAAIPKHLQGFPIALVTAGLMAIAFLGFNGLIK